MAWVRTGDEAATYPPFLRVDEHAAWDDRLKCEMFGFLMQCATLAAQHFTDYVVSLGTARLVAGTRAEALLQIAVECELMTVVEVDGRTQWKLIEDDNFVHMITKAESERNSKRKRDLSDKALIVPVRHRDGDQCRYCGVVVNWGDRKGGRGGTYDHREGLDADASIDNIVVACRTCNSKRTDNPDADDELPLLDPPAAPFYKPKTAEWINESEWATRTGTTVSATKTPPDSTTVRPATQAEHAPTNATVRPANRADNAPERKTVRPASRADHAPATPMRPAAQTDNATPKPTRPATQAEHAPTSAIVRPASRAEHAPTERTAQPPRPTAPRAPLADPDRSWQIDKGPESIRPGSGRAGPERDGTGGDGIPDQLKESVRGVFAGSKKRRGKRGGRGRGR